MTKATAAHKAQTPQSRQKFGKYFYLFIYFLKHTLLTFVILRYPDQHATETRACYTRKRSRLVKVSFEKKDIRAFNGLLMGHAEYGILSSMKLTSYWNLDFWNKPTRFLQHAPTTHAKHYLALPSPPTLKIWQLQSWKVLFEWSLVQGKLLFFIINVHSWSNYNCAVSNRNAATDTIKQQLIYVGSEAGKLFEIRQLVAKGIKPPVLIFVQSIERAKELFHELVYDGINVDVIHSDRTKTQVCAAAVMLWRRAGY